MSKWWRTFKSFFINYYYFKKNKNKKTDQRISILVQIEITHLPHSPLQFVITHTILTSITETLAQPDLTCNTFYFIFSTFSSFFFLSSSHLSSENHHDDWKPKPLIHQYELPLRKHKTQTLNQEAKNPSITIVSYCCANINPNSKSRYPTIHETENPIPTNTYHQIFPNSPLTL